MLINKNVHGYSANKKYVSGRGFVDSLSSIFNSIKYQRFQHLQESDHILKKIKIKY